MKYKLPRKYMTRIISQPFVIAGAIIEKEGKVLLVKEAKKIAKDKWSHPAGWIDVGENPIEAVKREVKEETGFDFTPTHILGIYSIVEKRLQKKLNTTPHPIKIIFLGNISDKKKGELYDDISEIRWFLPEEIEKMGRDILRDSDIKKMVKDYFDGKRYPLELITHTISE